MPSRPQCEFTATNRTKSKRKRKRKKNISTLSATRFYRLNNFSATTLTPNNELHAFLVYFSDFAFTEILLSSGEFSSFFSRLFGVWIRNILFRKKKLRMDIGLSQIQTTIVFFHLWISFFCVTICCFLLKPHQNENQGDEIEKQMFNYDRRTRDRFRCLLILAYYRSWTDKNIFCIKPYPFRV